MTVAQIEVPTIRIIHQSCESSATWYTLAPDGTYDRLTDPVPTSRALPNGRGFLYVVPQHVDYRSLREIVADYCKSYRNGWLDYAADEAHGGW